MKIVCIYDNHMQPNIFIKNIIGQKTFGEVILKRKSIRSKFQTFIKTQTIVDEVLELDYEWQLAALVEKIKQFDEGTHIIHLFSNFVIVDENKAEIMIKKAPYITENYVCMSENIPVLLMFSNTTEYCAMLKKYSSMLQDKELYTRDSAEIKFEKIETDAFYNLGIHSNFMQYISGGFDARFFNSVKGDEFTVVKTSTDKKKIKAEYTFYYLLPDYMKTWFVMPYNYQETEGNASYEMERLHITDLAIRWVHGAITIDEMDKLLNKAFHFIQIRSRKSVSEEEYKKVETALYLDKVDERIDKLKAHPQYMLFKEFIEYGTDFSGLDEIVKKYKDLFIRINEALPKEHYSVIGHGDLCFSNMLFNKEADLLKLIDPKGAVEENQMWTNPYYDVAKLSHSICGRYDFFNNGLHHISLDGNLKFKLDIDFDNIEYKKKFKHYVEKNGFSYEAVRIYEVSLFLSMLPLHMDNPQKVFGFILNAIDIMEEIESCLKN